jgi:DNA-binding transcriptional LysR family regulator
MLKAIDWDRQISRRLKLRDLHVFFTVAQCGNMAGAALHLGVSTPTVSEVIANLEGGIGVRLLDRSSKGVEPTRYGQALLKHSLVVFDELKQSIRDIAHLEDPTTGEIRIASPLAIAFTAIPHVFERFVKNILEWCCTSTGWLLLPCRVIFEICAIENTTSSLDADGRSRARIHQPAT